MIIGVQEQLSGESSASGHPERGDQNLQKLLLRPHRQVLLLLLLQVQQAREVSQHQGLLMASLSILLSFRYHNSDPIRYSQYPRFQSRFYR